MNRILCIGLLIIVVAFSLGRACVSAGAAVPALTKSQIHDEILADLAFNAPHVSIYLEGDLPRPAIDNFVRAGILKVVGRTSGENLIPAGRLVLLLTDRGQKIALTKGWVVGQGELVISTGRLAYVPGSYKLEQSEIISYSWRYEPNANLSYLLKIGELSSWPDSMYPTCLTASGLSLGRIARRTIPPGGRFGDPIHGCSAP